MNKEIKIIEKIFSVNYKPLTCKVFYIDPWDKYYIFVNEFSLVIYDSTNFVQKLKFLTENRDIVEIENDRLYDVFDNFLPHLTKKILIQTRRKRDFFDDEWETITERRNNHIGSLSVSGATFLNCQI